MSKSFFTHSSFGIRHSAFPGEAGFTLLEVLIGIAIFSIVSTGLYVGYASILEIVQASQFNATALSLIESHVEEVRNMRYEDVGTVGGVPAGVIPQSKAVTIDSVTYTLRTYVRNIDDPFDGQIGGTPNDTAPADYKLVELQVTCDTCTTQKPVTMTTWVAPKNLESSTKNGSLFVRVFDGTGAPVVGATVHVINAGVTPAVDVTDITNVDGMLQLVDTATSSAGYHITVTKEGYSSDQTYPPGNPANPVKPDATVATQQLTISSLSIDRVASLTVRARDRFCVPIPGVAFGLAGAKLIGTEPDVPKYSQNLTTGAQGIATMASLEWDAYTLTPLVGAFDIAGTASSLSFNLDPAAVRSVAWLVASHSQNGLLVSVRDGSGVPVQDAVVRLTGPGYDRTLISGKSELSQTDWSGAAYDSKSDGIQAGTSLTLTESGGIYATGSMDWLVSDTYDLGSSSTTFAQLSWSPASNPPQTTVRFQLAANNDGSTWAFVGPDGTAGSYFTSTPSDIPASLAGNRYLRYRVELSTDDPGTGPTVDDVAIAFGSGCLVAGQAYFNGLAAGSYTLSVSAMGFQQWSGPFTPATPWFLYPVTLTP
jgi:prepilin-type N-terminal cleavage/methylation domain-containing protein